MAPEDAKLLAAIESGVPLVREPYAHLAAGLGLPEDDLLARLARLRGPEGKVREISGVFDAAALGYEQTLVAFAVADDAADEAGRLVASHPGVSHCYLRAAAVNLWFTLAVSPGSALGLDRTVDLLAGRCGATRRLMLPAERRYKLHVRFAGDGPAAPSPERAGPRDAARPPTLTYEQRRAVRALQRDLPGRRDPFAGPAAAEGLDANMLLVHASDLLTAGQMRRYAAVLRHRAAGARANVLVAWPVAPERADAAGAALARRPEVSHCIRRPARPGWPYAVYTMVHGPDEASCRRAIAEMKATVPTGEPPAELRTLREYAKRRVRLFTGDEAAWEAEAGRTGPA